MHGNPSGERFPTPDGAAARTPAGSPTVIFPPPLASPISIPDHQLIRRIGVGSYGEVWLGRNVIGAHRAIKVVYRHSFDSDRPYEREFAGMEKFEPISRSHEGLVDILQIGRNNERGYFYYVMELADDAVWRPTTSAQGTGAPDRTTVVDGTPLPKANAALAPHTAFSPETYLPKTLRTELTQRRRLPFGECLQIGLSLSSALGHMHEHGLIHRDIKPSNIIFVHGAPKLADIGLVAGAGDARSFVGTEGFIPPEGPGTAQADVFSLGKVLYEISTGKDRHDFPELPPDLKCSAERSDLAEFNEIILKACANEPAVRYHSAEEMFAELSLLRVGRSVKGKRSTERRISLIKRLALPGIAALVLIAGTSYLAPVLRRWGAPKTPAPSGPSLPRPAGKTIAVLPFVNRSPDKADEYLGDELAEELADALTKAGEFRVVPRNTAFGMNTASNRLESARRLGVEALVEGSVRKVGAKLRLNVQLIRASDGFPIWSEIYPAELKDVFGVVIHAAERVAEGLEIKLTESKRQRMARRSTASFEAYALYLQGRWLWNQRTEDGIKNAIQAFEQALAKDANYALAHAGLADCYALLVDHGLIAAAEGRAKVMRSAERALALDDALAEAHTALAGLKQMNWDWSGAEQAYQRAIALDPDSAMARKAYAGLLVLLRRLPEALEQAKEAVRADPFSAIALIAQGDALSVSGRLDEALETFRLAAQIDPNYKHVPFFTGWAYVENRKFEEGIAHLRVALSRDPESTMAVAALGYTLGLCGQRAEAQKLLERLEGIAAHRRVSPYDFAMVYLGLGKREQALTLFEKAYAEHDDQLMYLQIEPYYSDLLPEPRYRELLKKVGLEK
ncbi:MAG: tetratricopeptide repeat protein [Verrucomicrobia bacterium]|nr:tetratricopeptide repeat protein [Verrucomicrobiota bacterium]